MSAAETFWIAMFVALVLVMIPVHLLERRRNRAIEDFEKRRRERKEEVERAARKAL